MITKDGENLNQSDNGQDEEVKESVVNRLLSNLPDDVEEPTAKSKDQEEALSQNDTDESQNDPKVEAEETENTAEGEKVIVTKEIAEQYDLDEEMIGQEVTIIPDPPIGKQIISKELAEELGLPSSFIGKPVSEAGKSYKETVKWENKNNQQIKELQNQIQTVLSKLSEGGINKAEKIIDKQVAEMEVPDAVTEPEKFTQWLKDLKKTIVAETIAEVGKSPQMLKADELAARDLETNTMKSLQTALPDGVKADDILDGWFEANQEDYEAMAASKIYLNKPEKFIKDVLTWYKASSFDSLKSEKASDIKKQVHKKTVENLRAKGQKTKTDYSTSPRKPSTDATAVGRILGVLEKSAAIKSS